METLPNPREELAFRKEGGLFWFLLKSYISVPPHASEMRNFIPSLSSYFSKGMSLRSATMRAPRGSGAKRKGIPHPALYKNFQSCTIREIFPRFSFLHSASFPVFPATSAAVHPAKGGLYGYFADQHSSVMCARNASLSSLQGYRAGSERGILDVSDMQSCHYASGAIAGSA